MSVKNPVEFNELYHHGVQGMKWGKRNGPPYPLNAQGKAKLAKQKKAGRASGGSGDTERSFVSDTKKEVKTGVSKIEKIVDDKFVNPISKKVDSAIDKVTSKKTDKSETGLFNQKQPQKQEAPIKDYSKMSKEDISAQKEKVIRTGDIREAYKNRDYYTDDELRKVKARYTLNLEVQQLTEADKKKGAEQVQKIAKNMETVANLTKAVSNIAINVANVYSAASRISTAKKIMTDNSKPAPKPQQPQQIGLFPPKQQQQVQQPVQQPPIQKPNNNKKKKKK